MDHQVHKAGARNSGYAFHAILYAFSVFFLAGNASATAVPNQPSADAIVQRSIQALKSDWQVEPKYDYRERDVKDHVSRTWQVIMILGSPYRRIEAVDGAPLSPERKQEEQRKLDAAVAKRCGESKLQARKRIENYTRGQARDHLLMQEITKAFVFKSMGETTARGRDAWLLEASPKPGYQAPNKQARVLTGMLGELWIDRNTFQWIKVEAKVIHPVSMEGFLAKVEPGTRFKFEQAPVPAGAWLPSEFSFESNVRVFTFFGRDATDDETYSDYQTADSVKIPGCPAGVRGAKAAHE